MKTNTTLLILSLFLSFNCYAITLEFNSAIIQGSTSTATSESSSLSSNGLAVYANLSKNEGQGFLLGWYILSTASKGSLSGTFDHSLSSSDMGPTFRWVIDKKKMYSITYVYGVLCKGSYNDGVTSSDISGTSSLIKFAVEPELTDTLSVGIGINQYTANYNLSVVNNTQSSVSYKNTWTFPSLSLSYRF